MTFTAISPVDLRPGSSMPHIFAHKSQPSNLIGWATTLKSGKSVGQLNYIDHFVVLMLENRSFDNLLGKLYPKSDNFEGLVGTENNPDCNGSAIPVWTNSGTDDATMRIPDPDPGELWTDINTQLFGTPNAPGSAPKPTMEGFVKNYVGQKGSPIAKNIMHCFTPEQVPVISELARQFDAITGLPLRRVKPGPTAGSFMLPLPMAMRTMTRRISLTLTRSTTGSNLLEMKIGKSTFMTSLRPRRL
jgi:hypothetical protein